MMTSNVEDTFPLRVYDIDKVKKSKVAYSSRSDTAKHLALVGTFLAAVQAQFLLITYLENSKPFEQAVNALFFLGQILDIFGTYYGLKEYNLYHWYIRLLEDLHEMMNDSKDDLAEIAKLVHKLESGEEEPEKYITVVYPDSSNRMDFPGASDRTRLQKLYEKDSIVKISKEYDRLRLLISKPNIEDVSSVGVLHCVFTNPLRLIVRPWTTLKSLQIAITKPVHGFKFSPIHWGIDCFVIGLVIFLLTSQPKGVWLLSLLAITLLVIHQEFLPRINRRLLAREMIQAGQYSDLPILPHEWFIYHSADFLLFSPNLEGASHSQQRKPNSFQIQKSISHAI